jgi:hypothetical protein
MLHHTLNHLVDLDQIFINFEKILSLLENLI